MYLSKLELNPLSRAVQNDLSSPYELHRTLKRIFPEEEEKNNRLLFRIEPNQLGRRSRGTIVIVQTAQLPPDWKRLPSDYCIRIDGPRLINYQKNDGSSVFTAGQHLAFRLYANPVEQRRTGKRTQSQTGKPEGHARYRREAIIDEEEQHGWLIRQGQNNGFRPLFIHTAIEGLPRHKPDNVSHENKNSIPHVGVRFDGLLEVTNPEKLVEALTKGIGPAKAFGFGLLSVAKPL